MTTVNLRGIPVSFPFKPYDIQKDYMEKVIECLQNETNGVLESPTGTGKTLSLLCSSLAWLTVQKAKFQAEVGMGGITMSKTDNEQSQVPKFFNDIPTIIYASRTHSQLTQAMQELKRTSYAHVRSTIVASRDQLCIHPDVMQQTNNTLKTHMCQAMVKARSCYLQNRVDKMSSDKPIHDLNIADIEDLLKLGQKHKFCPYYMTKELKKQADIIFLPYNYLLDPKARRANQLDLKNSVIILDEAHNVERVCEDSASFQLKTTDIALCIDEVTQIMKYLEQGGSFDFEDTEKDFSPDDLAMFKTMLLRLEEAIDNISLPKGNDGMTFEGKYIFEILKEAGIDDVTHMRVLSLLDQLIQFLSTASKENAFQRTGSGIQSLQDLLLIVFQGISEDFKEKINKCYKVHVAVEEERNMTSTTNTWLSKASTSAKKGCRILSYWCFSPNFGMQMLLEQGVRCIILTSGTLAPLKPLISELGINIGVRLENPHVVDHNQICVKILSTGPDGTPLNSGFQNRSNTKYISSLGLAIVNISRQIPHGLLIFFPSYALLAKCQESWQQSGIWSSMNELKVCIYTRKVAMENLTQIAKLESRLDFLTPSIQIVSNSQVFVEPKTKNAFNTVMNDYYERVKNPQYKGATFMAVCRGKVSEGLDFADINGRAVIITGLPYPPFKDPRVMLKRKYLDVCRAKNSEYLSGQDWYGLEATRAVNQAIGRVIRHRYDYGAILLLDNRFNNSYVKNQLSLWVRGHVQQAKNFGEIIREMRLFFKNANEFDSLRDQHKQFPLAASSSKSETFENSHGVIEIYDNKIKSCTNDTLPNNDNENKRVQDQFQHKAKRRKIILVKPDYSNAANTASDKNDAIEFMKTLKENLDAPLFEIFRNALSSYRNTDNFNEFINNLNEIFIPSPHLRCLIQGIMPYIKDYHKENFLIYWKRMR